MHDLEIGLLGFLLIALIISLAVKQVAHVLVYGSIFDWIRHGLKNGIDKKVPGAHTLHELFTCTLCVITQLTIWFIAIPLAAIVYTYGSTLPLYPDAHVAQIIYAVGFAALSALVVGAFATYWMHRVEYPSTRFRKLYDELEEAKIYIKELEASGAKAPGGVLSRETFTRAHFEEFATFIEKECRGISCPFRLYDCRIMHANSFLRRWAKRESASNFTLSRLARMMGPVFQSYAQNASRYRHDEAGRKAFLDRLYANLFPAEPVSAA